MIEKGRTPIRRSREAAPGENGGQNRTNAFSRGLLEIFPIHCVESHLLFLPTLNGHRRTLTKRFRWNLGKAPHLQAIAILRQLFSAPSLRTTGKPCLTRSQSLRPTTYITSPSPATASCPPSTGSLKSAISGPLPSKSFGPGNRAVSGPAVWRASPARQSR
jgi:hypothetical protein